jgi:uncharacterized protein (DUF1015 family)
MAIIKGFKAIRPTRDKAYLVASRSYLTYSEETLREKLLNNPYTFLHIINPEYSLNTRILEGTKKFEKVRDKYNEFLMEGTLVADKKECLYIYQQVKLGKTYTGIIAASAVDDYLNGVIKIHEQTISNREEMFTNYLHCTGFNAEPVLLTYPKVTAINKIIESYLIQRPEYEFTSTNKVLHNLWLVQDEKNIQQLQTLFEDVAHVYIADGHHRTASSALLCKSRRASTEALDSNGAYNYFMSFLIDDEQLSIFDFNRLLTDLNGNSVAQYILGIRKSYKVTKLDNKRNPKHKDEICMYLDKSWYGLVALEGSFKASDTVECLDPDILSKNILHPLHGIKDIRNDKRIHFLDGQQGLEGLERAVDSGKFRVAFALKPITVAQLKSVADDNRIMPPKSTFIEPKLRSGLTIYKISDD